MVAALADFLSSGVQLPTADYGTLQEHLTTGITHPEKVNPSRGSNSASRSSGHSGRRARTAYFHERRSLNNFHRDRVITFEQIA
ncbi:hypothetical protein FXI37_26485, partial [Escherichia coli]|nr:hypothetical protein [Escherichia coli]